MFAVIRNTHFEHGCINSATHDNNSKQQAVALELRRESHRHRPWDGSKQRAKVLAPALKQCRRPTLNDDRDRDACLSAKGLWADSGLSIASSPTVCICIRTSSSQARMMSRIPCPGTVVPPLGHFGSRRPRRMTYLFSAWRARSWKERCYPWEIVAVLIILACR